MEFSVISREKQIEILGPSPKRLEWGYHYPADAKGAIGARLIFENNHLSVLPDRISSAGKPGDTDARKGTFKTLVVARLEKFLNKSGIMPQDAEIIFGEEPGYKMLATPNASYGYVYLSFWVD